MNFLTVSAARPKEIGGGGGQAENVLSDSPVLQL
jgi:hypothetical protein